MERAFEPAQALHRRWSLRLRVAVAIMLAALAPLLVVFLWSQLDRNVPGRMWAETREAARAGAASATGGDVALEGVARAHRVRLRVIDERGEVVFEHDADDPNDRFGHFEELLIGASARTLREVDETLGPLADRSSARGARSHGAYVACDTLPLLYCEAAMSTSGGLVVHAQRSSRRAVQAVYALRAQLLRLAVFTVPLALAIALTTARRIVRPVEHLRRQALVLASGASPSAALDPERRDEVGALAEAFNVLLDALQKKRVENEAFVADLVHEMKNPVAAVSAAAEALAAGGVDEARALRLGRVLGDSSAKLDRLVSQFLDLARADAGMPSEERSSVELRALLDGLAARTRDDPNFGDVRVTLTGAAAPLRVRGVSHRLDALFRELFDNGASFAGPRGELDVTVARDATGGVVVSFHDSGPGIAEADLARVFDRFFTTRGERRGTGLGLALVRAVARAHGGDVEVRSERGATFTVRLPLEG